MLMLTLATTRLARGRRGDARRRPPRFRGERERSAPAPRPGGDGATWTLLGGDSTSADGPELLLRMGLSRNVELRVVAPDRFRFNGGEASSGRWSDSSVGIKGHVAVGASDFAVRGTLNPPTGSPASRRIVSIPRSRSLGATAFPGAGRWGRPSTLDGSASGTRPSARRPFPWARAWAPGSPPSWSTGPRWDTEPSRCTGSTHGLHLGRKPPHPARRLRGRRPFPRPPRTSSVEAGSAASSEATRPRRLPRAGSGQPGQDGDAGPLLLRRERALPSVTLLLRRASALASPMSSSTSRMWPRRCAGRIPIPSPGSPRRVLTGDATTRTS